MEVISISVYVDWSDIFLGKEIYNVSVNYGNWNYKVLKFVYNCRSENFLVEIRNGVVYFKLSVLCD